MIIETKFDLGENVFCMASNTAVEVTITEINIHTYLYNTVFANNIPHIMYECKCHIGKFILREREIFKTKQLLIESMFK